MKKIPTRMKELKMILKLKEAGIRLGSEKAEGTDLRRVVITRDSKRVYGSKLYANMTELNNAWLIALKYEYNKLNKHG